MAQDDLLARLNKAFEEQHQRARARAAKEGKREFTQADYDTNPVVKLAKVYDWWGDISLSLDERVSDLEKNLGSLNFSADNMRAFHAEFPRLQNAEDVKDSPYGFSNDSINYILFMCTLGKIAKSKGEYSSDPEIKPFFDSGKLMPQLTYLATHTSKPRIKFDGLDTVVLTGIKWGIFNEFNHGKLTIDCALPNLYGGVGNKMKGGTIRMTDKVKPDSLGWNMEGGTLIYDGDFTGDGGIGEEMKGGTIQINGDVYSDSNIGHLMQRGSIIINGSYIYGKNTATYGAGHEMKGGTITIKKDARDCYQLGWHMKGGQLIVEGSAYGKIDVGTWSGQGATIEIKEDCLVKEIGTLLAGGEIKIGGNAEVNIASSMESGLIRIRGNATNQSDGGYGYSLGCGIKGGVVEIGGDLTEISSSMEGGTVKIGGNFIYKDSLMGGGQVYERGVLVPHLTFLRVVGKILKLIE